MQAEAQAAVQDISVRQEDVDAKLEEARRRVRDLREEREELKAAEEAEERSMQVGCTLNPKP